MNQSLRAEQINHYYPFGLTFADAGKGAGVQPCKHGGKELDAMYGLYWSDFGARHYSPQLCSWTSIDPMCETSPHESPYMYCGNSPFEFVDFTGLFKTKNDAFEAVNLKRSGNESSSGWMSDPIVGKSITTGEWFVALNDAGTGLYTAGGTVTLWFGPTVQRVSTILSKTVTAGNAVGIQNGMKQYAIEYAAKGAHGAGRVNTQDIYETLGKDIGRYYKGTRAVGNGIATLNGVNIVSDLYYYHKHPPVSDMVYTKILFDGVMTALPYFLGPAGFAISTAYFLIDVATDGFGINYDTR